jgi:alkylation response protein AidB-like acyl-CoA dehydrogenase
VLSAALCIGIAEMTTELAVEYAKKREQFDRPIASFQAIKHFAADMHVRHEVARAAVYAAGATFDDPSVGDVARAVASARVVAAEAAMKNARMCIQIYGGMGYTWEMPPHYYLKRAFVLEHAFTAADEACETIAERIDR